MFFSLLDPPGDAAASTLIVPAICHGNVGQLAVDLLLTNREVSEWREAAPVAASGHGRQLRIRAARSTRDRGSWRTTRCCLALGTMPSGCRHPDASGEHRSACASGRRALVFPSRHLWARLAIPAVLRWSCSASATTCRACKSVARWCRAASGSTRTALHSGSKGGAFVRWSSSRA